jgi:lecithin:cholesterol acyltransferase
MTQRPCIVIPGIVGSSLENSYPIAPVTTWSALGAVESKVVAPDFDALALDDPADADFDAQTVTRPSALLSVAYSTLVAGIRGRRDVPAYLFPYDWRYSNGVTAQLLVRAVRQLQKKSMPSLPGWDGRFDFVVHSMGGLVLRAFLNEWRAAGPSPLPVGQVVFIATPNLGSIDAVEALISGEAVLFGGRKELRKLLRTFPAVYELLPRFQRAVIRDGADLDVFDERNWQQNITALVQDRDDDYGVTQHHLTEARAMLTALPDPVAVLPANDLLVIYGAKDSSTTTQVVVSSPAEKPANWYDFDHAQKGPGDDVVPVVSALLAGVAAFEVRTEDVSYFRHPIERGLIAADLHAFLPALDEVGTVTTRFLNGKRGGKDLLPLGVPQERYKDAIEPG